MKDITIIGIDLAKNYLQIHGTNNIGKVLLKKRVTRENFLPFMANLPRCLIGMEACAGAHYFAEKLITLGFEVKLMSPRKVKKFVDNHKNDAKDAQACCQAVARADMTFVPVRTATQIEIQSIHRIRSHYVRQQTALMNMIRGILFEYGIVIPQGRSALCKKLNLLLDLNNDELTATNKMLFRDLYEDLKQIERNVEKYTNQLIALARTDEHCQQLQTIEGIGPISATALIGKIGNGSEFKKGRELSAYLGLVPKQCSSGEKQLLLGISKHGDRYIRQLLVHGGSSVIQAAKRKNKITGAYYKEDAHSQWVRELTQRVGLNKASVAIANKNARLVIGILKNKTNFVAELAH